MTCFVKYHFLISMHNLLKLLTFPDKKTGPLRYLEGLFGLSHPDL